MARADCKNTLEHYLKTHQGWFKKSALYAVAEDWSPETVGRKLRLLVEEGKIKGGFYDGRYRKNLKRYTADEIPVESKIRVVQLPDGSYTAVMR